MSRYTLPGPVGSVLPSRKNGKAFYIAPEQLNGPHDGYLADIWSLGIILFMMITGSPPVAQSNNTCPRFVLICQGKIQHIIKQWSDHDQIPTLTDCAIDLISRILIP